MLGCDIVEIRRIEKAYGKFGMRFARRILTPNEIGVFEQHNRRLSFLAGRFAAKESISKTLQTGLAHGVTFHTIEVLPHQRTMSPQVRLLLPKATQQLIIGRLMEMPNALCGNANAHAHITTNAHAHVTTNASLADAYHEAYRISVEVSISHCRTYAMAVSRGCLLPA